MRRKVLELLMPSIPGLTEEERRVAVEEATGFCEDALAKAPCIVRFGEAGLRVALWLWMLPVGGIPKSSSGVGWKWMQKFILIPGPTHGAFRLYSSLGAIAMFENVAVARALNISDARRRKRAVGVSASR